MKFSDISRLEQSGDTSSQKAIQKPIFDPVTGSFTSTFVYDPIDEKKYRRRKFRRKAFALTGFLSFALLAFIGFKLYLSATNVIQRNSGITAQALSGDIELSKLRGEGEGRVNILLLGVGDKDHAGSELSDSIMVASIDPRNLDTALLSIPRDMYVKIPNLGYDRINAAHAYGEQNKKGSGPELAKETISSTLDIPIHYFIRIDFSGLKKAVDSVGGVDIDVKESLYDPEYPCDKNEKRACGFSLKAGRIHMDGNLALKYSRCRKGNCGNDFGRAARQQQVMSALRNKAMKASILANPLKIGGMLDVVGEHVKTDLQLGEIQKLAEISQKIDQDKIINKVIDDSQTGFLVGANMGGASVLKPKTGDYKQIQAFVHSIFADNYIKGEAAKIVLGNGTNQIGLVATVTQLLKSYNYNIIGETSPTAKTGKTIIYDYTKGKKPYTIKYLENRFGVKAQVAERSVDELAISPADQTTQSQTNNYEIKIIIGSDYFKRQ